MDHFSWYSRVVFPLNILIFSLLISATFGHWTSGYSHESSTPLDNSKWMSTLPDEMPLSSISLPGTHETLSRGYGTEISECQTLTLELQLKAGIRVLDVRCRHIENSFAIHHGMVFMHLMFGDVLQKIEKFLQDSPTETVLMRIKEEYDPLNITLTFEETFKSYFDAYPTLFWRPNEQERRQHKLGSARGKVVVLDDFSGSTKYGINYRDWGQVNIQDDYRFTSNWDLYPKWEKVKEQLNDADVSRGAGENTFFLNYLTGSYGTLPYFVASGHVTDGTGAHRLSTGLTTLTSNDKYPDFPRLDCVFKVCTISFEGINVLAMEFLQKRVHIQFVGIIMADFPGDGLISSIISLNQRNLGNDRVYLPTWAIMFVVISATAFVVVFLFSVIFVLKLRRKRRSSAFKGSEGAQKQYEANIVDDTAGINYQRF